MKGEDLRAFRESKDMNQPAFAVWLNEGMGRAYDRQKVSRWENGSEKVPEAVIGFIRRHAIVPVTKPGPAYTVAFANQKGGVGKTVGSVNVAAMLSVLGYKTLLVDADAQINATLHLGIDGRAHEKAKTTLCDVLRGDIGSRECVVATEYNNLYALPSSPRLATIEGELMKEPGGGMFIFRERLADVKGDFDFIIVDTPPTLGQVVSGALSMANGIIVPCQTEWFSIYGLESLLNNVKTIRSRSNPELDVLGIIPTLFTAQHTQDQASLQDLHDQFGPGAPDGGHFIFPPIPRTTAFGQSTVAQVPLALAGVKSPAVSIYQQVTDIIVRRRLKWMEELHAAA